MRDTKKNDLKLFTSKLTITIIIIFFFTTLGATYAYFAFNVNNNNTITGNAATVNLVLEVNRIFPISANEGHMVPQQSVSGSNNSPLSTALKSSCIDANSNVVCQVYKILIKNDGGTATEVVDGQVSFFSDAAMTKNSYTDMPNLKWKLIDSVDIASPTNSVLGTNSDNSANFTKTKFVSDVTLPTNKDYTYYMIVWFNETGNDQTDEGKTFYGMIEFTSSNGTGVTSTFA